MKYIVYYRVSTKRQGESGLGLEAQKSYIQMFLDSSDIIEEITEVKSAKNIYNRPGLNKALELCKKNGYGLAFAKVDRLSRNTEQALSVYNDLEGKLFSCDIPMQKGGTMDKFNLTLYLAFAERERFLISERTKVGLSKSKKLKGYNNEIIKKSIDTSKKIKNSEIGMYQMFEASERVNTLQVYSKILEMKRNGFNFNAIAKELSARNSKGELINKYPKYGKEKNGKTINSDWQAIQVKRIYDKYKNE